MKLKKYVRAIHQRIVDQQFNVWNAEGSQLTRAEREGQIEKCKVFDEKFYGKYLHVITKNAGYIFSRDRLKERNEYSEDTHCTQAELDELFLDAGSIALDTLSVVHCVSLSAIVYKLAVERTKISSMQVQVDVLSMLAWPHFFIRFVDLSSGDVGYYDPWVSLQSQLSNKQSLLITEEELPGYLINLVNVLLQNKDPYAQFKKVDRIYDLEKGESYNPYFSDDNIEFIVAHSNSPQKRVFPKKIAHSHPRGQVGFFNEKNSGLDKGLNCMKGAFILTGAYTLLLSNEATTWDLALRFSFFLLFLGGIVTLMEKHNRKEAIQDKPGERPLLQ